MEIKYSWLMVFKYILTHKITGSSKRLLLLLLSMVLFASSPVLLANCPNPTTNKPAVSTQTDTNSHLIILVYLKNEKLKIRHILLWNFYTPIFENFNKNF